MALVLAAPPVVPVVVNQWKGLHVTWEGPDGSAWDLNDSSGGVVLLEDGVEGLHFPKITKFSSTSRAIPGKRLRGWRPESRDVFWSVLIWSDGSDEWLRRQAAFFATLHPENPGTWRVATDGGERSLQLTGVFDDDYRYVHDPRKRGWAQYGIALEAADPLWQGKPNTYGPWKLGDPAPFIGAGGAPPFHIGSSGTTANATASNPGDVDVWPVWKARDECGSLQLGIGSTLIEVPFDLSTGDQLVIDTDPRNPTATLNGVDSTAALGLQDYAQVPPGADVPLTVSFTGTGTVTCTTTPLFFRAF
nr:hypothetical protein [Microbacterium bovistercoris]